MCGNFFLGGLELLNTTPFFLINKKMPILGNDNNDASPPRIAQAYSDARGGLLGSFLRMSAVFWLIMMMRNITLKVRFVLECKDLLV